MEHRDWKQASNKSSIASREACSSLKSFNGRVAGYVDATRLVDGRGHGQRLVYLKVGTRKHDVSKSPGEKSLASMLSFRQHSLTPWIKAEVLQRFDYLACETIEEFKRATGPAMTRQRHLKTNEFRHEKDDRSAPDDRRHFVLGWDNRAKRMALQESIETLSIDLAGLRDRSLIVNAEVDRITQALDALEQVNRIEHFEDIDYERFEYEASQLRLEKQRLEESNDVMRDLRHKANALRAEVAGHQLDRDQHIARKTTLESEEKQGRQLLDRARTELDRAQTEGRLEPAQSLFTQSKKPLARH